jgi:diguanylate cyclase (GGDEF)-like protein
MKVATLPTMLRRVGSQANAVDRYVAAVVVGGIAVFVAVMAGGGPSVGNSYGEFWLLALFVVLGELMPVRMLDGHGEITTSTIFTFALLLRFGPGAAILAQAIASIVADLATRKAWWKVGFNVSGYALALGASGVVLRAVTETSPYGAVTSLDPRILPPALVAGATFFMVNHFLPRVGMALSQGAPVLPFLLGELPYYASVNGVLLALSPIVLLAGEKSLVFIPLLALPMGVIYKSATVYAEKEYKSHQALHDSLTGLPNRALFYDRVERAIAEARRSVTPMAILLIDLDRFKEINDSLGHHIGDLLLQQIGPVLQSCLRESDTVARLGGDEFAVVLPHIAGPEDALTAAGRINELFERPFVLEEVADELALDVEASIGIALYPEDGEDVPTLIQRADVAMYVAKESHSGHELYAGERDRHSATQLAMLGDLRRGIAEGELSLVYQPKAEVRSRRVVGAEVLVRWNHPRLGLVMPDQFVPAAERTGLIGPLTLAVLDEALGQLSRWRAEGFDFNVAVNLARRNLLDPRFPEEAAELLAKWGIAPGGLELEITESSIMADPMRAADCLLKLNGMGIKLALDDFGAGYSSLSHLKRLPVGEIKIDKSFVVNMLRDRSDRAIVRSTIELAHNLGLEVTGEGVESSELWAELDALNCDVAQGFYLSRPLAALELTKWLRRNPVTAGV